MDVKMVCAVCGSEDVKTDANARWSVVKQEWEVVDVYIDNAWCNSDTCDGAEVEIEEGEI